MKAFAVFLLVGIALPAVHSNVIIIPEPCTVGDCTLPLAQPCDAEACQLPDCRCSSTAIPGGLAAEDTPQFVTLTFDDAVTVTNIDTYREILYGRINKNKCPVGTTFFVNHEYTNYQLVNELYNQGFEIALHSISHDSSVEYWKNANFVTLYTEFIDQRTLMAHFANIPRNTLIGVRIPFFQLAGNTSYQLMSRQSIQYDSSWPTLSFTNPPMWPYTPDYASIQDCVIPPCPTASFHRPWVLPIVSWWDLNNNPCFMVDSCLGVPDNEDEWFTFILQNFERHYKSNRAPFGFNIHEWYVRVNPHVKRALVRFLDYINNLSDVFMVNSHEVMDWVRNPVPLDEYMPRPCRPFTPTVCRPATCMLQSNHNEKTYWMSCCNNCPRYYPWLGDPFGQGSLGVRPPLIIRP